MGHTFYDDKEQKLVYNPTSTEFLLNEYKLTDYCHPFSLVPHYFLVCVWKCALLSSL